jgi:hypothetical protein
MARNPDNQEQILGSPAPRDQAPDESFAPATENETAIM